MKHLLSNCYCTKCGSDLPLNQEVKSNTRMIYGLGLIGFAAQAVRNTVKAPFKYKCNSCGAKNTCNMFLYGKDARIIVTDWSSEKTVTKSLIGKPERKVENTKKLLEEGYYIKGDYLEHISKPVTK